jgi:hypothetical protein
VLQVRHDLVAPHTDCGFYRLRFAFCADQIGSDYLLGNLPVSGRGVRDPVVGRNGGKNTLMSPAVSGEIGQFEQRCLTEMIVYDTSGTSSTSQPAIAVTLQTKLTRLL